MVRGVHKKIIEVADTQNEFFERAILLSLIHILLHREKKWFLR